MPAKLLRSCLTLCDHMDYSQPGSSVHGILQARTLEWVAISFSNAWKWKEKVKSLSRVRLFATPWTAAYRTPPSMGFSRQEYWSGMPVPSPSQRLGRFKQQKFIFLQFWELEVQVSSVSQLSFFWGLFLFSIVDGHCRHVSSVVFSQYVSMSKSALLRRTWVELG